MSTENPAVPFLSSTESTMNSFSGNTNENNSEINSLNAETSSDTDNIETSSKPEKSKIESNTTTANDNENNENEDKKDESIFECNICLETAKDAVVSLCGHLFCWPCLHQWLETRPRRKLCPVCKAAISKSKVIPLYGRGRTNQEDPRNKVPPRPAGQRTEPELNSGFQGFGFSDSGFQMSFGISAFPFGYFTSSFNFPENRPGATTHGTTQYQDEQQLSKLFLYLALICIGWLIFA